MRKRGVTRTRRGVTFLELTVVLVIMSVMFGIALPTMRGTLQKRRLPAAARDLAATARLGRMQAVLRGHPTQLRIQFEEDLYRLEIDEESGERRSRQSQRRTSRLERVHTLGDKPGEIYFHQVETSAESDDGGDVMLVRFYPNGSASPTRLVLADLDGRALELEIAAATGAIRVLDAPKVEVRKRRR